MNFNNLPDLIKYIPEDNGRSELLKVISICNVYCYEHYYCMVPVYMIGERGQHSRWFRAYDTTVQPINRRPKHSGLMQVTLVFHVFPEFRLDMVHFYQHTYHEKVTEYSKLVTVLNKCRIPSPKELPVKIPVLKWN